MKINNKTDFSKTLNLPKQVIGIKGNQVKKEDYILEKIQDVKKYQYVVNKNIKNGGRKYKIIEMPTDIENKLSSTIILNKLLKDFVVKNKLVAGDYINHELIFTNVSNMQQIDALPNSKNNLQELLKTRQQKRKELANMFKGQTMEINNLGTTINYDKQTLTTIKTDFEVSMIEKFYEMYKSNKLEKQLKSVHWCTKCGTSKRRKDLVFKNTEVNNYYVLYRVKEDKGLLSKYNNLENTYFIASTIRPWAMVSSENIAISKDLEYSLVELKVNNKPVHYIIASDYVSEVMQKEFFIKYDIKMKFNAKDLNDFLCMNPLDYRKRVSVLITDTDKVSYKKEDSTGVRIVSSGHTYIDYLILKDTKNESLKAVIDEFGKTNAISLVFQNMEYLEVNTKIIEYLKESNFIYSIQKLKISLPFCDSCESETIYRCINDWYVVKKDDELISEELVDSLASKIYTNIKYKKEEFVKSVNNINKTKEALISDKNIMGTPIPVFYCADCGANIISEKTVEILSNMIKTKGSDNWYKQTPEEILQGQVACMKCGCTFFFKENATLNNFFKYICINLMQKDSFLKERLTTNLLIESKEEFINNLKALSFIPNYIDNLNKFDKILVHSNVKEKVALKVIDEEKAKQQKSKENKKIKRSKKRITNIEIEDDIKYTVNHYGTDILRLWAAIFSNKEIIYLNKNNIININKKYKNIRKVFKYLLSNLYDYNPNRNYVDIEKRNDIDKYIYNELYILSERVKNFYSNLEFDKVCKDLTMFGEEILCKKYFDSIKYKLYILNANDIKRRAVQSNLYDIILTLCGLWLPIIPFTLEEIWQYIYHRTAEEEKNIFNNVTHLKDISVECNDIIMKWKRIFAVKEKFDKKIKYAQTIKQIKSTLEVRVILNTNDYTKKFVEDNYDDILQCINVSSIEANISLDHNVKVEKEKGKKCVRCNHYTEEIGKNLKYRYLCPKCADILDEQA